MHKKGIRIVSEEGKGKETVEDRTNKAFREETEAYYDLII